MQFGKCTLFLVLNGTIAFGLLCYFGLWLLGSTAKGQIQRPLQSNKVVVHYTVQGTAYRQSFLRSGIPFAQRQVVVRYLTWKPAAARINSFMGLWAEPLAWWLIFLIASAMLLLTNNTVFSRGTRFQLHKGFPWISMDEYFPEAAAEPHTFSGRHKTSPRPPAAKKLPRSLR